MSNKPTHRLIITDKENHKRKTRAGVLFKNQFGYTLSLNPGVILRAEDHDKYFFNVNPIDERWGDGDRRDRSTPPEALESSTDFSDDGDLPF